MTVNPKKPQPRREPWQFQDAKAKLSEVFDRANDEGPQFITRRGENAAVLLSYDEYIRLKQSTTSLYDALRGPPGEVPWERDERPRASFKVVDLE